MEEARRWSRAPLKPHPEFSGQAWDLPGYLEDVAEQGKAQGTMDTLSLVQLAIDGAPPRVGRLWTYLVASASILERWDWDNFKALVTLQYPEIEPIEDRAKLSPSPRGLPSSFPGPILGHGDSECPRVEPSSPALPSWPPTPCRARSLEEARIEVPFIYVRPPMAYRGHRSCYEGGY
ncbi:hypothetical protein PISMIDRAFT_457146 [Pisolithus microcarpus 441]|uniref:Uncharacterized protein n=1 Tax=Pisolithus microcarpus 441 TaxID=765257 RepID=A0A0C9Y5N2_9AGAM|nr:hypothetical protein PISMIDRAFT_457146 [Pisolithus microcarpus 441]